jgi:hypothetical protein
MHFTEGWHIGWMIFWWALIAAVAVAVYWYVRSRR